MLNKETSQDVYSAVVYQGYLYNPNEEFRHKDYCKILIENNKMSYGQAQKIVNMAFKYMFCLVELSNENPYYSLDLQKKFSFCHMPLDGIMLEWIRRKDVNVKKTRIGAWSNMCDSENDVDEFEKYTYSFYSEIINKICKDEGKTPLQINFENWKEMTLILASDEFLKNIDDKKIDKDYTKHEWFERIKQVINQYV